MDRSLDSALLADVEAFCEEVRPSEELAYLEHRFNDEAIPLAKKYNLLGMMIPVEFGGRGARLRSYLQAHVLIGREGTGLRRRDIFRPRRGARRSWPSRSPSRTPARTRSR
jgi:alkylation response protein AidB-like acyl-CoA dehydrogenase